MDTEHINELIHDTIRSIVPSVGDQPPACWFRTTIEDPTDGREPTAADVRLSYSREVSRTYYGSVTPNRNWLDARLTLEGVPITINFPFRTGEDGMACGDRYLTPTCKTTLLGWFDLHRPNKKFPLDINNPALQFKRSLVTSLHSTAGDSEWSKPARVVAACNEWLTRFGYLPLETPQGNTLLAAIDELLSTNKATCAWTTDDISSVYHQNGKGDVPYTSCMSGGEPEWFALYDYLQSRGLLSLVEITRDDVHVGRALVWHGSNPDDLYMDRVYAAPYRDSFEPDVVRALKEFCKEHDIRKCVYPQTAERLGLEFVGGFSIATGADPSGFSHYPYLDSLRYFGYDGRLRMSSSHGGLCLDQTDGGPDDDDYTELENGDRVPNDDARHCDYLGECHHVNAVTYSNYHGDYILDTDLVELHNGAITYRDNDDLIELHDGEYAIYEDATELHDGTYALDTDITELHDGTYALSDDVVELHDGTCALHDDPELVMLHDGSHALREDTIEREDGTLALREELDEPEPELGTAVPRPEPAATTPRAMPADLPPLPEGYDYVGVGPLFPPRDDGRAVSEHPPGYLASYNSSTGAWMCNFFFNGNSHYLHYAALRGTEVHRQLLD